MSIPVKQTVTCPKCGKPIEFTMWQSINTEMDFALPDIISGKLFEVSCKGCGFTSRVDYPILFNDMQRRKTFRKRKKPRSNSGRSAIGSGS